MADPGFKSMSVNHASLCYDCISRILWLLFEFSKCFQIFTLYFQCSCVLGWMIAYSFSKRRQRFRKTKPQIQVPVGNNQQICDSQLGVLILPYTSMTLYLKMSFCHHNFTLIIWGIFIQKSKEPYPSKEQNFRKKAMRQPTV